MTIMETQTKNTTETVDHIMNHAWDAYHVYRKCSLKQRADFMRAIALELAALGDELIETAMKESHLPMARLKNEGNRTIFQLNSYADYCESGQWLEARIDTEDLKRTPVKPDIRKMLVGLGPVVVFGASNFPFAYSTAGGDTASAFAAGCPVIVKAHPAHPETSNMVAAAIDRAAANCYLPTGVFTHIHGGNDLGEALVKHPFTKAVGFTGSLSGGRQLFDWGNQRKDPIPVFAEMGSVNPVFLLPAKTSAQPEEIANMFAGSITLSAGQFCTNPGIIVGVDNEHLETFIATLSEKIKSALPEPMLHTGIYKSYVEKRASALSQSEVDTIAVAEKAAALDEASPTIASVNATVFLENPLLHQEVFGPYSIIVKCRDMNEMVQVVKNMEGQLTATLMGSEEDILSHEELVEAVKDICGRLILNGVPTGVEVCMAMQHGGPYPACTDSRFTAVGGDAIKRFARPVSFQNWPDNLLPEELRDKNSLEIWRTVNNKLTQKNV